MIHPVVRKEIEVNKLLSTFNDYLKNDDFMLIHKHTKNRRPVFVGEKVLTENYEVIDAGDKNIKMITQEQSRLFIGSSSESLKIARAIHSELDHDCYPETWNHIFKLSSNTLTDLMKQIEVSDFAVFVFSPDDITIMRDRTSSTVRDNIIFELGLFMGKLGQERVFFVRPNGKDLHLPTDLLGINYGVYYPERDNLKSAVTSFCNDVRESIEKLGKLSKKKL